MEQNTHEKSCCIFSQGLQEVLCDEERLAYLIYEKVNEMVSEGIDTFYFVAIHETDILAAEQVLVRRVVIQKNDPKKIQLIAVLPYENQADKLNLSWQERLYYVLSRCDEVITLNRRFNGEFYQTCCKYISEKCSRRIVICHKSEALTSEEIEGQIIIAI